MEMIVLNDKKYSIVKNEKDAIVKEDIEPKLTEYFASFDYILGDYSYGKLRLKGFNSKENKNYKKYNAIESVDDYIRDYCAYGCRHFIIALLRD